MSPYLVYVLTLFSCVQALTSTTTVLKCKTRMGKSSVSSVKTTTKTEYVTPCPATLRITTTPTVFVTPAPISTTVTQYVSPTVYTTGLTITDIISTTSYSTITGQTVETVKSTTSTSIVVTTSIITSVVPTSPGFRFVADTTGSVFPAKKRAITHPHDLKKAVLMKRDRAHGVRGSFPQSVGCVAKISIKSTITSTRTAIPTLITLAPSVISITVSSTVLITSTIVPRVSSINTIQSVIYTTTTSTTTEYFVATSTNTVFTTVTSYDACATPNILGPLANGNLIDNIYNQGLGQPSTFTEESSASPYDCCVACVTGIACTGSGFYIGQGLCILLNNGAGTCGVQSSTSGFYVSQPSSLTSTSFIVSNGNCGYLYDGGIGD